jgi:hypothetical protein
VRHRHLKEETSETHGALPHPVAKIELGLVAASKRERVLPLIKADRHRVTGQ